MSSDTLSLHDALPISSGGHEASEAPEEHEGDLSARGTDAEVAGRGAPEEHERDPLARGSARSGRPRAPKGPLDRKSTRLNSSHLGISYAVCSLKRNIR